MNSRIPFAPRRRSRLRLLLLVSLVLFVAACVWMGGRLQSAKAKRQVVQQIERNGGTIKERLSYGPLWLEGLLGEYFVSSVRSVSFGEDAEVAEVLPHFGALPDLVSLDLSYTKVTDDDLAHLKPLEKLEALELSHTSISDGALAALLSLGQLERLDLSATKVTDEGMAVVAQITSLKRLWLEGTQVGDRGLEHLTPLKNLELLAIGRTRVRDDGLKYIAQFPRLGVLRIEDTSITDEGLAHLAQATQLDHSLYLTGTQITSAGLEHLASLFRLQSLDLTYTQVSTDAVDQLRKTLPLCRIIK